MQHRELYTRVVDGVNVDIEVDVSLELDRGLENLLSIFIKTTISEEFLELKEVLILLLGAKYAGMRYVDGWCELYFYVGDAKGKEAKISSAIKDLNLKYESGITKDAKWDFYHKNLYPSEFEFLLIDGYKIADELELEGDNIDKKREIEHYIFFQTPTQMQRFLAKAKLLGYEYKDEIDCEDYGVAITKEDNLSRQSIINFSKELYELAKEDRGSYELWSTTLAK